MIVPSIDIMNGKAVQLRQGKKLVLESKRNPVDLAREFNRFGEVAVIDLDSALNQGNNRELIAEICKVADVRVGGGIRSIELGRNYLKAGAKSLIIGTKAEPEFLKCFPAETLIVALDHKNGEIVDNGWQAATGDSILERASRVTPYCSGFLCTSVEQEGCLTGINVDSVEELQSKLERPLTIAGGIATTDEIAGISRLGVDVQVGMALYTGRIDLADAVIESLTFGPDNLIPTIVQNVSGQTLMMAYSSPASLKKGLTEGRGIYFSRSRKEIWEKGMTSGNIQNLVSCRVDCDRDCLLFTVDQVNGACHTGSYSCFSRSQSDEYSIRKLFSILRKRKDNLPASSYTASLFRDRKELLGKIAEESREVCSFNSRENLIWEIGDLLYFLSVLAVDEGIDWQDIENELGGRQR